MGKNKKRQKNNHKSAAISSKPAVINQEAQSEFIKKGKNSLWGFTKFIGAFTLGVISVLTAYEPLSKLFRSEKEEFDKELYVDGTLKAPLVESNADLPEWKTINTKAIKDSFVEFKGIFLQNLKAESKDLVFKLGTTIGHLDIDELRSKPTPLINGFSSEDGQRMLPSLYGYIKDKRLYISCEFKDLLTRQSIGWLDLNYWKLFKPNLMSWQADENRLEVIDKQHQIVFSIEYEHPELAIKIKGYFLDGTTVHVIDDIGLSGFQYEDLPAIEKKIRDVKSIFK